MKCGKNRDHCWGEQSVSGDLSLSRSLSIGSVAPRPVCLCPIHFNLIFREHDAHTYTQARGNYHQPDRLWSFASVSCLFPQQSISAFNISTIDILAVHRLDDTCGLSLLWHQQTKCKDAPKHLTALSFQSHPHCLDPSYSRADEPIKRCSKNFRLITQAFSTNQRGQEDSNGVCHNGIKSRPDLGHIRAKCGPCPFQVKVHCGTAPLCSGSVLWSSISSLCVSSYGSLVLKLRRPTELFSLPMTVHSHFPWQEILRAQSLTDCRHKQMHPHLHSLGSGGRCVRTQQHIHRCRDAQHTQIFMHKSLRSPSSSFSFPIFLFYTHTHRQSYLNRLQYCLTFSRDCVLIWAWYSSTETLSL